ncbi:MAG: BatA domain-containing protein [Betaproteobacteria bacterium]|nr:MAG: BatA domain-containing protein [Betaproteobacteria bacterium]
MNAFPLSALVVGGAVAATLAAVMLLYLLRPPARHFFVSSNLIWQKVLEATRRVSDRWRWWLSVLIASVACVCIVLAVVRPGTEGAAGSGKAIIVVDNAPTMATRTGSGAQRFELAKDRAVDLINDFSSATQVMVVDTQRRLVTPAFESRNKAIETVLSLELGQSFQPIVPSAIASIPAEGRYVVTDGVLLGLPPSDFVTVSVFEAAPNLGITAFDFQNVPGDPAQREAFVEVFNAGSEPVTTEVVISGLGEQRVTRKISIEADSFAGHTFDLSDFPGGPIRAALTSARDGYADDDIAYGYLSSRRIVRVTLVTRSDSDYLAKSLSAQPRVRLNTVSPRRYMDQVVTSPNQTDIFVFDRFVPSEPPSAPALLIGARSVDWLPARAGTASFPEIASADTRHSVLRDISLRDLSIEQGNYLQSPNDASTTVLLRTSDEKVLALAHDGAMRWVLLGFDVASSNFGLLAGFPLFLGNSINWLADEPEILREQPGMVTVPFDDARVYAMDGSEVPVVTVDGRSFFDATRPGLYTALGSDRPLRITVNLLERRISNVNQTAVVDETEADATDVADQLPVGLSALLLMLAAALLFIEWLTYHRRITV